MQIILSTSAGDTSELASIHTVAILEEMNWSY